MRMYKLEGRNVVPANNVLEIERLFESPDRIVGKDEISKDVQVSTVFLVLDHRFSDDEGPPILFETMIFGGQYDQCMWRYCTYEEAEEGHKRIVTALREGLNPSVNSESL